MNPSFSDALEQAQIIDQIDSIAGVIHAIVIILFAFWIFSVALRFIIGGPFGRSTKPKGVDGTQLAKPTVPSETPRTAGAKSTIQRGRWWS